MSSPDEPTEDAAFSDLPSRLRAKIDRAFDRAATNSAPRSRSHKADAAPAAAGFILPDEPAGDDAPGGFIPAPAAGAFLLDDEPAAGPSWSGGGFIPPENADEDEAGVQESAERPTHIPFSRIPTALQMLDLPPDDEEVLAVLRNAASGWAHGVGRGRGRPREGPEAEDEMVSRKDWRAVCAVLLESEDGADEDDDDVEMMEQGGEDEDEDMDAREIEESEGDATSDEYVEESTTRPSKRRAAREGTKSTPSRRPRRRKASASDSSDEGEDKEPQLTARQKRECLRAFALFFPGFNVEEEGEETLRAKRIGVRELSKASSVLKEKIKAEEMLEMLEAFSTLPDKTVGLADFERMMFVTRMV